MLETMTEESDFSGLGEPLGKALEDLERYVHTGQSPPPIMTSDTRAIYRVESKILDHIPDTYHSQERRSGTGEVSLLLWEVELQKVLEIIDVCGHLFRIVTGSELLQEYLRFHDVPANGEDEDRPRLRDRSPEMVCCFDLCMQCPVDHPRNTAYRVGVSYLYALIS